MDPDEIRGRVARRIREVAARRKVSLGDLAGRAKVSRSHLFAVLGGERAATTDVLTKLATALEVDPHDLLRPDRVQGKGRKRTSSSSEPSSAS